MNSSDLRPDANERLLSALYRCDYNISVLGVLKLGKQTKTHSCGDIAQAKIAHLYGVLNFIVIHFTRILRKIVLTKMIVFQVSTLIN